jgi:hypothetical protein
MIRSMRGLMVAAILAASAFAMSAAPAFATDLSVTAASVVPGSGAVLATGTAGEALTAGQAVYQKAADSKWYKADCNSATAEVRVASAIALGGAAAGQPVVVQKSDRSPSARPSSPVQSTSSPARPAVSARRPTTPRATIRRWWGWACPRPRSS